MIKQNIETVKVRTIQHGKIMFAAATNYDALIQKEKKEGEYGPVYQVTDASVQP